MSLFAIDVKHFKTIFIQSQTINAIAIITGFLLVNNGFYILSQFDPSRKLTTPILLVMVALSFWHGSVQKKRLAKINTIEGFDEKVNDYKKYYKARMLWLTFSCIVSIFLYVLTARNFFLYFAIFDLVVSFIYYPKLFFFQKELQNEDIMFY